MATSRSFGGTWLTTRSPMRISPAVMFSRPAIMRSRVDLPQPDGPTRTTNSPSPMVMLTPWMTSVVPKIFLTSRIATNAIESLPLRRRRRRPLFEYAWGRAASAHAKICRRHPSAASEPDLSRIMLHPGAGNQAQSYRLSAPRTVRPLTCRRGIRKTSGTAATGGNRRRIRGEGTMAADKADVLMLAAKPVIEEGVAGSPLLELHRLWQAPDREAALATLSPRIRALAVAGGHGPVDAALLARFPRLEVVASFGVGYDHVDAAWAGKHGIVVTNTPDVLTEAVADTALGLLLATVRQLPQAERYLRAGKWRERDFPLTPSLRDRTVGILGLGRIGKAIARRLEAMHVPVVYHSRNAQADVPYRHYASLVDMAREVDVLLVITPGGAATRHLVDARVLEALGPDGILINVARGSVVDQQALIAALQQ